MTQFIPTFQGSIVALITPMLKDGKVDWKNLKKLVEWHIQQKTKAIVAVGTTGEPSTLSMAEHAEVIKEIVRISNKRIPIIAGTGSNSTQEAIELTQEAEQLGADAVLAVTPYYNKPTQEGLFQHFKAVAKSSHLPVILYNVPSRTGVDMKNETVFRLADVPNIIGIKDATGDLVRGQALIEGLNGKIRVFSGDDGTAAELMLMGAKGNISVTANVAPLLVSQMCEAALVGDQQTSQKINQKIANLNKILFCESNPIPVKWALHEMDMIDVGIRLPLTPLSEELRAPIREALKATGII